MSVKWWKVTGREGSLVAEAALRRLASGGDWDLLTPRKALGLLVASETRDAFQPFTHLRSNSIVLYLVIIDCMLGIV